jgi:Fe-S cluster assembly scaffold protein SufB
MAQKSVTMEHIEARLRKLGETALAELRRRGISEPKIKRFLARKKRKSRKD